MTDRTKELAVLPYKVGELIHVLLTPVGRDGRWGLAEIAPVGGGDRCAHVAMAAREGLGVTGRVYKSPLRVTSESRQAIVFPLLVKRETPCVEGSSARWFTLREAADNIDVELLPVLDAFVRRIGGQGAGYRSAAVNTPRGRRSPVIGFHAGREDRFAAIELRDQRLKPAFRGRE